MADNRKGFCSACPIVFSQWIHAQKYQLNDLNFRTQDHWYAKDEGLQANSVLQPDLQSHFQDCCKQTKENVGDINWSQSVCICGWYITSRERPTRNGAGEKLSQGMYHLWGCLKIVHIKNILYGSMVVHYENISGKMISHTIVCAPSILNLYIKFLQQNDSSYQPWLSILLVIKYLITAWSVWTITLEPTMYERNFSNANTSASNSFSVVA